MTQEGYAAVVSFRRVPIKEKKKKMAKYAEWILSILSRN